MPNVVIVTTMWSKVDKEEGNLREEELRRDVWTDLLRDGCTTKRFEDTYTSAWNIVDSVTQQKPVVTLIQKEMGDSQKSLHETTAGVQSEEAKESVPKSLLKRIRRGFVR